MERTSFSSCRKSRLGWSSHQWRLNPKQIYCNRFYYHHRFFTKTNRRIHCLEEGKSASSWLVDWYSFRTDIRPCSRPRYNLYCLECSKKWICRRLPRTRIHPQTTSHLFLQRRWQNHWRTHSNLQRTMQWPCSYWETNFRQRKNILPPHKSWPSIWNIHYHNAETTKTFLPEVGLSIAEPRPKKKLVPQSDK